MNLLRILHLLRERRIARGFIAAHERQFDPSLAYELWAFAVESPDEWPDPSDDTPGDERGRGECAA